MRGEDFGGKTSNMVCSAVDEGPLALLNLLAQVLDWGEQVRTTAENSIEEVSQDGVDERSRHIFEKEPHREHDAENKYDKSDNRADRVSIDFDLRRDTEVTDVVDEVDEA